MTLKETLKKRKGQRAKVGIGSGFVWFGTITDETPDFFDKLDDQFKEKAENSIKRYLIAIDMDLDNLRRATKDPEAYYSKFYLHAGERKEKKDIEDLIYDICDDYVKQMNALRNRRKYLKGYKRVLNRPVTDTYACTLADEPIDVVIIIQGEETGEYWLYDEFKRAQEARLSYEKE